jgi:hypothetical protein
MFDPRLVSAKADWPNGSPSRCELTSMMVAMFLVTHQFLSLPVSSEDNPSDLLHSGVCQRVPPASSRLSRCLRCGERSSGYNPAFGYLADDCQKMRAVYYECKGV